MALPQSSFVRGSFSLDQSSHVDVHIHFDRGSSPPSLLGQYSPPTTILVLRSYQLLLHNVQPSSLRQSPRLSRKDTIRSCVLAHSASVLWIVNAVERGFVLIDERAAHRQNLSVVVKYLPDK